MAMILSDRVQETTSTVGTGNLTLAGVTLGGFRSFTSVMATGDTAPVAVVDPVNNVWECGIATMQSNGSLALAVSSSSSGGSALSLASNGGQTLVMLTPTADFLKNDLVVQSVSDAISAAGIVQFDGVHWSTAYNVYAELADYPAVGNTLIGWVMGANSTTPPTAWSTLQSSLVITSYQNGAIYSRYVGYARSSKHFGPTGITGGNSSALAVLETTGFTSRSSFYGTPSSVSGNDLTVTLPTCGSTSVILLAFEWDGTYIPISSATTGMSLITDFGSGDFDSNHAAYLFWLPGSMSGQSVTLTLTSGVSYPASMGLVMTP